MKSSFAALLSLLLASCNNSVSASDEGTATTAVTAGAKATKGTGAKPVDSGIETSTFGAPLTIPASQATPLLHLVEQTSSFAGKKVRTEGTITAVCKSMGCWMDLAESDGKAHITMAGHKFFIPKDASGKRASVEGTVLEAASDSCGADSCKGDQDTSGRRIEIEATSVSLIN